jgi:hypothetical protein
LHGAGRARIAARGKLTVLTLAAATYFMVSGGPYGLEDVVRMAGYAGAIAILLITPLLWSIPAAMMVSELASAMPEEGGFYIWVRRGLGPFWGYQETWLTLAGSIFEMALYPTLFVDYLGHFAPALTEGHRAIAIELILIAVCTAWNLWGARAVGEGSVWMSAALLAPFVVLIALVDATYWFNCCHHGCTSGDAPRRHSRGRSDRDVELHGLGQYVHGGGRGRSAAAHVSARDAAHRVIHHDQLHHSNRGDSARGHQPAGMVDRRVG